MLLSMANTALFRKGASINNVIIWGGWVVRVNDNAMITIRGWGGWVVRANDNVIIFPPKAGSFFDLITRYCNKITGIITE